MSVFRPSCPTCFMEEGYSIKLTKKDNGIFVCDKNKDHKFKRNGDGDLIPANGSDD